jgi:PAS domain S-box-containing protein
LVVVSAVVAEIENDFAEIGADSYIAKGPFATVGKHVMDAVQAADTPPVKDQPQRIMGLESVSPRQLTKELLSRNRHLKTILESMGEGILEVIEGSIVYANNAAIKLFRLPLEKIIAVSPLQMFEAKSRPRVEEMLGAASDKNLEIGEKQPIELNGRQVTIKYLPVNNENQSSIILITDITERKRLEMQLQHAQKMEAIGTIASGVAHNFRNTLTGILVNSQVIQENYPEEPALMEVVRRIDSSVKRGAQLVERLMQFSRKETKKEFKSVDLVHVLAETYQIVKRSFDQNVHVSLKIDQALPIIGDHSGLSHVFMNLFTNARDAMPNGGKLNIESLKDGQRAVVRVSDTGDGMDEETRKKCFDPFFTTKEVGKGTGLGLSTTYGIVKSHDGEIQVSSTPGQGTTFTLRFPLSEIMADEACERPAEIVRGNGQPVLVVDDEAEIQAAMRDLLDCLGYKPVLAALGDEALEIYKIQHPDVVLMDVNLPEENGLSCAAKILDFDPEAKIAVLSGYDENGPELADKQLNGRIKGFLTKPVDMVQLSGLLARLVE